MSSTLYLWVLVIIFSRKNRPPVDWRLWVWSRASPIWFCHISWYICLFRKPLRSIHVCPAYAYWAHVRSQALHYKTSLPLSFSLTLSPTYYCVFWFEAESKQESRSQSKNTHGHKGIGAVSAVGFLCGCSLSVLLHRPKWQSHVPAIESVFS